MSVEQYPTSKELKKPTPFNEVSSKKLSYVYLFPGKDLFVVAGFSSRVGKPVGVRVLPSAPFE